MKKTHGASNTRLYRIWTRIRNEARYAVWGRQGFDDMWSDDFAGFRVWAESHGYTETARLKRRDKLKAYTPDNCYWVDTAAEVEGNIINHTFGRLTVMREVPKADRKPGRRLFVCKCECGKEVTVQANNLLSGATKSCGCLRKSKPSIVAANGGNLRIGRLTILEPIDDNGVVKYRCLCDCGNMLGLHASDLASGRVTSCGCVSYTPADKAYIFSEGDRFGSLTVIGRSDKGYGPREYMCECDCGELIKVYGVYLRDGSITSCGKCNTTQAQQSATVQSKPMDIDALLSALDDSEQTTPASEPNPLENWDNF